MNLYNAHIPKGQSFESQQRDPEKLASPYVERWHMPLRVPVWHHVVETAVMQRPGYKRIPAFVLQFIVREFA